MGGCFGLVKLLRYIKKYYLTLFEGLPQKSKATEYLIIHLNLFIRILVYHNLYIMARVSIKAFIHKTWGGNFGQIPFYQFH